MADTKITKTFAEMEEEADRNLNQFAFLLFIPNPTTKTVKYYVDGEKVIYVKSKDDFIRIIKFTPIKSFHFLSIIRKYNFNPIYYILEIYP